MIYLDNAATTLVKPDCVAEAVTDALGNMGNTSRGANKAALSSSVKVLEARMLLAGLFNAGDESRVAFTSNSTEALNMAIKGCLKAGDHVITTVWEHNSVLRPLYEMEDRGVNISFVGMSDEGLINPEDIRKEIRPNTAAVITTHASNLTGDLVDINKIGKIAKDNNLLYIVDASQTAGVIDIDVEKSGIDILCFTGHKSLLGPQGTGGIYVRDGVDIKHFKTGGSGTMTFSHSHPDNMPDKLEAGTLNGHGICGLCAAVKFINETGISNIREKEDELMKMFYNGVKDIPGVKIYGNFNQKQRCPIVSLNIGDEDSGTVSDILSYKYDIATRSGGHCAPLAHIAFGTKEQGMVRFSFNFFNTEEEVKAAINAIADIAK
ncbi:MAG: aminotransferase class V-fold PLP-dependent enzyme [Eubacterium sp.]|nr:aminotransferase class V-fold PLP-dependent enzyme [Eubacterium sp.]